MCNAPALAAITGSIICIAVAASAAAAFHHSASHHDAPPPFHATIRLESIHTGYSQVHAVITMTHSDGPVMLGGGISNTTLPHRADNGMLIYEGLLNTTAPAHPGDMVPVIIYHGTGRHVMQVEVW